MNMHDITPIHVRVRMLGHDVALTITSASAPTAGQWLNNSTIDPSELGDIQQDLCMHRLCGEFEAMSYRLHTLQGHEPLQYAGRWQVIPDYRQLLRIFRWWYNYGLGEALTQQAFEGAYGKRMGEHYWEKWCLYERSISRMIGYFGTSINEGQKFLDMLMDAVARYEIREREQTALPIASPTKPAAETCPTTLNIISL